MLRVVSYFLFFFFIMLSSITYAKSSSLSYAAGQMMMVGFAGTTVDENSLIVKEIKKYHIGGVILDYTNIDNPAQLKNLTKQLQFYAKKYHDYPLFITLNQEGGKINALKTSHGFDTKNDPSQFELGQLNNPALIYNITYKRAQLLKSVGINLNLAPVADLNINPNNPGIGQLDRSFGADAERVTKDLMSAINAYKKAGVLCTLKHFPGLGSADQNTDFHLADLTNTWNKSELIPYEKLISIHTICPVIMSSHLMNRQLDDDRLPASLSKAIITNLLIKKMHYQGLIITDDMDATAIRNAMPAKKAIKKAVLAGNNIILYGGTQEHNPYDDAEMLYNALIEWGKRDYNIKTNIFKSANKIKKCKNALLKSSVINESYR